MQMMNEKIEIIKKWTTFKYITQGTNFLELIGFYTRFVKVFTCLVQNLIYMLEKYQNKIWVRAQELYF